jgi:hypothetical protein
VVAVGVVVREPAELVGRQLGGLQLWAAVFSRAWPSPCLVLSFDAKASEEDQADLVWLVASYAASRYSPKGRGTNLSIEGAHEKVLSGVSRGFRRSVLSAVEEVEPIACTLTPALPSSVGDDALSLARRSALATKRDR